MLAHKVNHPAGVSVYVPYITHDRFCLFSRSFLHDLRGAIFLCGHVERGTDAGE